MGGLGWRFVVAACCSLLAACGEKAGTPVPEPPALFPIEPSAIGLLAPEASVLANQIALGGDPGVVSPDARIIVSNLGTGTRDVGVAGPDGGFRVDLTAETGDVLRLEADVEGGRTPPTDLLFTGDALEPSRPPMCITLVPDSFVVVDEATSVGLASSCDDPVIVDGIVLLFDDGSFGVELDIEPTPTSPISLSAENELLAEVTALSPSDDGDVLRFDVELDGARWPLAISLRQP